MTISAQTQRGWGRSQTQWKATPRFTAPVQPEPEKKKLDTPVPSQVQSAPKKPHPPKIIDQHPQSSPHFRSVARGNTLDRYIRDARKGRLPDEQRWKCPCGFHNKPKDSACRGCRAPKGGKPSKSADPNIAQDWKHVKRIGDSSEQEPEPVQQIKRPTEPVVDRQLEEERRKRLEDSTRKRFVELESHFRKPSPGSEPVVDKHLEEEKRMRLLDSTRKRLVEQELHLRKPPPTLQDVPNQPVPVLEPPKTPSAEGPRTRIHEGKDGRKGKQSNEPGKSTQSNLPTESLPPSGSAKPLDNASVAALDKPEPTSSTHSQRKGGWKKWDPSQARPIPEPPQSAPLDTSPSQEPIERDGKNFKVDQEKPVQKDRGVPRRMPNHAGDDIVSDDSKTTHDPLVRKVSLNNTLKSDDSKLAQSRPTEHNLVRATLSKTDRLVRKLYFDGTLVSGDRRSTQARPTENDSAKAALLRHDQPVRKDSSGNPPVSEEDKAMQPRFTKDDLTKPTLPGHDQPEQKDPSEDTFVSDGYELMQSRAKPERFSRTTASQYDQPERKVDVSFSTNGLDKKIWKAWKPSQPEENGVLDQPMQPRSMPDESIGSPSPGLNRSGQGDSVPSLGNSSGAKVWKTWHPVQNTKADFAGIFSAHELNDSASVSTYDDGRVSTEEYTQDSSASEMPPYVSSEEMKVSEHQATENRMDRRRQQLEEESSIVWKKPAQTHRFDDNRRERRTRMLHKRKIMESEAEDYDYDDDSNSRRQQRKKQRKRQLEAEKLQSSPTPIYLPAFISVANLAGALRVRMEKFTRKMKELGFDETNNDHVLDTETAGLIAAEFNFEPMVERADDQDLMPRPPAEDKTLLPSRPPVVTIMGHVDHGKTTLLDWLRKSSVAASEYGGITQHIGAFSVPMPSGRTITFLDTPGHAAFLEMRQRGANVTDIVILVVAADDSVKPQTIEAIKHAQSANVPMIVAVNKIDKEDANADKVKQDLARYGVEIEDYGGDTQVVCVSGKSGQGMETLEESVIALADILDMRAETDGPAEGWVLEATTKKAGRVATVLVRRGTLYPGDIVVAGTTWTRIRSLRNEAGVQVGSASPGTPVEIDGWRDQPAAGDEALQADDEQHARSVVDIRLQAAERADLATDVSAVNEARKQEQERRRLAEVAEAAAAEGAVVPPKTKQDETPGFKHVPFVIKADVSGSVEAVLTSVLALGNNFVRASVLRSGVGAISEFDVAHAASAQGHIIAFNIAIEPHIRRAAETSGVKIFEQNVIYRLVDLVKGVLEDYLEPLRTKRVLGEAEVAQVFEINVKGRQFVPVAGCKIRNGVVGRKTRVLVKRGEDIVFDGRSFCVTSALSYFLFCNTRT